MNFFRVMACSAAARSTSPISLSRARRYRKNSKSDSSAFLISFGQQQNSFVREASCWWISSPDFRPMAR